MAQINNHVNTGFEWADKGLQFADKAQGVVQGYQSMKQPQQKRDVFGGNDVAPGQLFARDANQGTGGGSGSDPEPDHDNYPVLRANHGPSPYPSSLQKSGSTAQHDQRHVSFADEHQHGSSVNRRSLDDDELSFMARHLADEDAFELYARDAGADFDDEELFDLLHARDADEDAFDLYARDADPEAWIDYEDDDVLTLLAREPAKKWTVDNVDQLAELLQENKAAARATVKVLNADPKLAKYAEELDQGFGEKAKKEEKKGSK